MSPTELGVTCADQTPMTAGKDSKVVTKGDEYVLLQPSPSCYVSPCCLFEWLWRKYKFVGRLEQAKVSVHWRCPNSLLQKDKHSPNLKPETNRYGLHLPAHVSLEKCISIHKITLQYSKQHIRAYFTEQQKMTATKQLNYCRVAAAHLFRRTLLLSQRY